MQFTSKFYDNFASNLMPNPSIHAHRLLAARKSSVLTRRELQKAVMEILG